MRRWIGIGIVSLLGLGALVAVFSSARSPRADGGAKMSAATIATLPTAKQVTRSDLAAGVPAAGGGVRSAGSSAERSRTEPARALDAASPAASTGPVASDRVVKHATIDVRVGAKHLADQFAKAQALAGFLGGYVEQSDQSRGLGSVTMRVPVARFDEAVARLSGLGKRTGLSERGDDVSAAFSDLEARVRNLAAQEGVLQDLMRQARSIADTITVQQQLSQVRGEIEQLTGQRNLLDNQTSLATVAATLHANGVAPAPREHSRSTLGQAWKNALNVAVAIVGGTMVVLGALIPLGLLAALVVGGWWIVRRRRVGLHPAGV